MLFLLLACSGSKDSGDSRALENNTPVALQFAAAIQGTPFSCGTDYPGVGTSGSTFTATDLRFYIHDVRLTDDAGTETPVMLDQDGLWQYENLGLLDFEDKSGPCENGTTETNTQISGTVAPGTYTGIKFVLGVPFDLNHQDVSTAASPLNLSTMFWGWEGGYKFLRLEGKTTGIPSGYSVHLGSTGCVSDQSGQVTECTEPNRAEISLSGFDPSTSTIVFDAGQLFATTNIDQDGGGAPGCMSTPDDPECETIFTQLGLKSAQQAVFLVQ